MRLICPNCGAQYEVPDGVIPEQGRDVQCSNCAHTWFQPHPDQDPELAEELGQDVPGQGDDMPPADTGVTPPTDDHDAPGSATAPETDQVPDSSSEPEYQPEPEPDQPKPAPDLHNQAPAPNRRELDPSIAELLREEAEFEARQRQAQGGLETQPELGLSDPPPDEAARRALEARRRMASRKGEEEDRLPDEDPTAEPQDTVSSRRELLPDIEEINSSLNADGRRPAQADDHRPGAENGGTPEPSGFRRGFALGLLLIVLCWALYVFADPIRAKAPQIAGILERYTTTVDRGRTWLDIQTKALLVKLDDLAAASEK